MGYLKTFDDAFINFQFFGSHLLQILQNILDDAAVRFYIGKAAPSFNNKGQTKTILIKNYNSICTPRYVQQYLQGATLKGIVVKKIIIWHQWSPWEAESLTKFASQRPTSFHP